MTRKTIIAIGRQFGSNGFHIGKLAAQRLGLAFYDKELLEAAAKESGLDPALFEHNDESPINSLLYSLSTSPLTPGHMIGGMIPITQQVYLAQFDVMRRLAEEKSCLFMGRCADYILRNDPHLLSVYIHAPLDVRIQTVMHRANLSSQAARDLIVKTDKRRANFYSTYADHPWGQLTSYHLTIDSSVLSVEDTADLIVQMAEKRSDTSCAAV